MQACLSLPEGHDTQDARYMDFTLLSIFKANHSTLQVFLTDMKNFNEMNGEYEKWFTHKPARTCVAVYQLPKGTSTKLNS